MIENEKIVEKIVEGAQEKKARRVVIVDMSSLSDAPCSFFVICEGDSNTQVRAITHSIKEYVHEELDIKSHAIDGLENAEWVAMDYGQIIVHVFQRPFREFYDLESLWLDAKLKKVADLD